MAAPIPADPGARASSKAQARAEFGRMMRWIALIGVLMVAGALWYLSLFGPLTVHLVVATTFGVFVSVLLGAGLFAAAFFSSKSGYDQSVTDATRHGLAANPEQLPEGLESYRRTADFTETTVPAALLGEHNTKAGSWGLIHVIEGRLRYRVTDPRRAPLDLILTRDTRPGIVEPTILHHVEPLGAVRFHVEFWREPQPASE
ncbi:MAG TPA: DUF1971 domain-containing protein [Sphingomonas sp.]|nr:DUF1971 domain-containing protein [Sphingomonas sp.]